VSSKKGQIDPRSRQWVEPAPCSPPPFLNKGRFHHKGRKDHKVDTISDTDAIELIHLFFVSLVFFVVNFLVDGNSSTPQKKAMDGAPMAFFPLSEQVVSDHQRQWADRKGTEGPEGAVAPG
jgi:hypothetical protein